MVQNVMSLLRARGAMVRRDAKTALRDLVVGVLLALFGLLIVLLAIPVAVATLILALAELLPAWLAGGIGLLTMVVFAAVLFVLARLRLRRRPRFLEDLKEDWRAIREHLEREQ